MLNTLVNRISVLMGSLRTIYVPTHVVAGEYMSSRYTYFKWVILNIRTDISEYVEQI